MLRIHYLFPILLCIAFVISAVQAYTITNQELTALEKAVSAYSEAIQNADTDTILNAIPPQIIDSLAAPKNISRSQFQQIMKSQIEQLAENYKIESIHVDLKQKREGELDNGIPYFVIPVEFVTATNAGKRCIQTEIIALFYSNQWYFIRGNDEAILNISNEAFPGLEKIKINPPKITKIP